MPLSMPLPATVRAQARPARLPRNATLWLDGLIAVAVFVGTALPVAFSEDGKVWHILVAAGASLPLIWRRRAPLLTTVTVGLAISVLGLSHQMPPLPFGPLVATYTFASLSPSPWRQVAIGRI